jgi:hypothetical protein
MADAATSQWRLNGTVLVACNCDYGCPCNFNALPTYRECEGGWTWHVEDEERDGVSLSGLTFSLLCDWPGAIHEGNGEAMILIDVKADDQQRAAILGLLRGEAGGPWGILKNNFSTVHEPKFVPFRVEITGSCSIVSAGDALELATQPFATQSRRLKCIRALYCRKGSCSRTER